MRLTTVLLLPASLLTASVASSTALANPALQACCVAAGAGSCPDTLQAVGPRSTRANAREGLRVRGLWSLTCPAEGASPTSPVFDADAAAVLPSNPPMGRVLTPVSDAALDCFSAVCPLPTDLCLDTDASGFAQVVACPALPPLTLPLPSAWSGSPDTSRRAVVVDGQVLAYRATSATAPVGSRTPVAAVRPPPTPGLSVQPAQSAAVSAAAPAKGNARLPAAPPTPCPPRAAVYDAVITQVEEGDDAWRDGDAVAALGHYRASLSIDTCNAYGWAGLGEVLLAQGHAPDAATALGHATRLFPRHFRAWSLLGDAFARQRRAADAKAAYTQALQIRPDHGPARDGLAQLRLGDVP